MKAFPRFTDVDSSEDISSVARSSAAKFVQDSSLFSISLVIAGLCSIIRTFILAKLLGPEGFGTWRFINIFAECLHFASLGTQPALHRWIPFLRGRGDAEHLDLMISTAFTINLYCSILYSAAVFLWSFFLSEPSNANALAAFAPVILLLVWVNYTFGFSMDIGLQGLRSQLEVVHAFLTLLFSLVLISFWGLYGAIYGLGISALVTIAISYSSLSRYYSFFKIDWSILRVLIITGLPIMADIVLPITMSNIDRILIAAMLTPEILGIYSIGNAGVTILGMIPSAIGQMLFVKFAEMHGQNRTKEHMADIIERTTLVLSSLFAPILSLAIVFFPVVILVLLPDYVKGIAAGRLLIAAVFFLTVSVPTTKWCVSTGHYVQVLTLRLIVITAEFLLIYFIIGNGGGSLTSIACSMLVAFAVFSFAMSVICYSILDKPFLTGFIRSCKSMLPFVSILSVIVTQNLVYRPADYLLSSQLFTSIVVALAVGCVLSAPFLYRLNRCVRLKDLFLVGRLK
jgi:O-antigen/teichoic acid export membrane protein